MIRMHFEKRCNFMSNKNKNYFRDRCTVKVQETKNHNSFHFQSEKIFCYVNNM